MKPPSDQLLVIGGGAAGIFCAVNAARLQPSLKVCVLEKSGKLLSKVKVSGGGRCNVTHACYDIAAMSRHYPRGANFVKKAFHQFFTTDCIRWFTERGVSLHTEKDGRMFPATNSSQTIIDCLLQEAARYRVEFRMHTAVTRLQPEPGGFSLHTAAGEVLQTRQLCVAAGGFSKPEQFNWLRETGHTIAEPVPSLFTFNIPGHPLTTLMGISVTHARVKINGTRYIQEGPLLVTHWGLSGPAILKLSAFAARELKEKNYDFALTVNWLPAETETTLYERLQSFRHTHASQKMVTRNDFGLPARLWEFLARGAGVSEEMRWADMPAAVQHQLVKQLCSFSLEVKGKTTFKEEFVTAGGIALQEVDPQTMMSRLHPGLYFAGEALDVDGITGGFNFQHAWTSGFIAAKAIAASAF